MLQRGLPPKGAVLSRQASSLGPNSSKSPNQIKPNRTTPTRHRSPCCIRASLPRHQRRCCERRERGTSRLDCHDLDDEYHELEEFTVSYSTTSPWLPALGHYPACQAGHRPSFFAIFTAYALAVSIRRMGNALGSHPAQLQPSQDEAPAKSPKFSKFSSIAALWRGPRGHQCYK